MMRHHVLGFAMVFVAVGCAEYHEVSPPEEPEATAPSLVIASMAAPPLGSYVDVHASAAPSVELEVDGTLRRSFLSEVGTYYEAAFDLDDARVGEVDGTDMDVRVRANGAHGYRPVDDPAETVTVDLGGRPTRFHRVSRVYRHSYVGPAAETQIRVRAFLDDVEDEVTFGAAQHPVDQGFFDDVRVVDGEVWIIAAGVQGVYLRGRDGIIDSSGRDKIFRGSSFSPSLVDDIALSFRDRDGEEIDRYEGPNAFVSAVLQTNGGELFMISQTDGIFRVTLALGLSQADSVVYSDSSNEEALELDGTYLRYRLPLEGDRVELQLVNSAGNEVDRVNARVHSDNEVLERIDPSTRLVWSVLMPYRPR